MIGCFGADGLVIPVTFSRLSACFSGRLLTCTAGSCGIHRRDEGHGLTFVYFKGDMLCLNVVVLFPADLERDRDV